jgi:hypothetical protein
VPKFYLKKGRSHRKTHIEKSEKDIKELDPRNACKYLGIQGTYDIKHKNEKEKLNKEYLEENETSFGNRIKLKEYSTSNGIAWGTSNKM